MDIWLNLSLSLSDQIGVMQVLNICLVGIMKQLAGLLWTAAAEQRLRRRTAGGNVLGKLGLP